MTARIKESDRKAALCAIALRRKAIGVRRHLQKRLILFSLMVIPVLIEFLASVEDADEIDNAKGYCDFRPIKNNI